jgi:putative SOS response-associated peptidase YedK
VCSNYVPVSRRDRLLSFFGVSRDRDDPPTYNARSETVDRLPSFREAWSRGWRCIIPAEAIYEPNWESGACERWAIYQEGGVPMGIAGIYRKWRHPDGREVFSFAMLTVNADGHPLMQRFHQPEDEKRMVVILHPDDYAEWLSCPVALAPKFFRRWEGPLEAQHSPPPPRAPRDAGMKSVKKAAAAGKKPAPAPRATPAPTPAPPTTGDLF